MQQQTFTADRMDQFGDSERAPTGANNLGSTLPGPRAMFKRSPPVFKSQKNEGSPMSRPWADPNRPFVGGWGGPQPQVQQPQMSQMFQRPIQQMPMNPGMIRQLPQQMPLAGSAQLGQYKTPGNPGYENWQAQQAANQQQISPALRQMGPANPVGQIGQINRPGMTGTFSQMMPAAGGK